MRKLLLIVFMAGASNVIMAQQATKAQEKVETAETPMIKIDKSKKTNYEAMQAEKAKHEAARNTEATKPQTVKAVDKKSETID